MEGFEVRKGRGKCCNYITSKVKDVLKIKKKEESRNVCGVCSMVANLFHIITELA